MNYGDLIKDVFWITLRNRLLWYFGYFVAGQKRAHRVWHSGEVAPPGTPPARRWRKIKAVTFSILTRVCRPIRFSL